MVGESRGPIPLPSVRLGPEDLRELEAMISNQLHDPDVYITVGREGTQQSYTSFDSAIKDNLSPVKVRTYEVLINGDGTARIATDSSQTDNHTLYLDGADDWCEKAETLIQEYFERQRKPLRSRVSGRYATGVSIIATLLIGQFFTLLSPFSPYSPASQHVSQFYLLLVASSVVFLASAFRHKFFPYASWNLRSQPKHNLHFDSLDQIAVLSIWVGIGVFLLDVVLSFLFPALTY